MSDEELAANFPELARYGALVKEHDAIVQEVQRLHVVAQGLLARAREIQAEIPAARKAAKHVIRRLNAINN